MENKKVIIGLVVGVVALILLTVGATYAYFTFNSQNDFGTQVIDADIEELGSGVTLTNLNSELSLEVKVTDMLEDKIGSTYYASGSATPAQIAKMSVDGAGTFNCLYVIKVVPSSSSIDTSLLAFVERDNELIFNIDDEVYDLNQTEVVFQNGDNGPELWYHGMIDGITSAKDEYVTANLSLANTNYDQTSYAGKDLTLTMNVETFSCTVAE